MNSTVLEKAKQIGLLVVDEGHRLKNSSGSVTISALNKLACEARLLITGTPIQNDLAEFYTIASFVCPGVLGSLTDFRQNFGHSITMANRKNATGGQRVLGQEQARTLDDIIKSFLLRRLAKDVLTKILPPRTEMLLFCRPSPTQRQLYNDLTSKPNMDPLPMLTKLRKLCSHPDLLSPNSSACSIGIKASGKLEILGKLLDEVRMVHPDEKVVLVLMFYFNIDIDRKNVGKTEEMEL